MHMNVYHMNAQFPYRPEEGLGSSGPGVTMTLSTTWVLEPKLSLQEIQVHLTEPVLQSH